MTPCPVGHAHRPVFPRTCEASGLGTDLTGQLRFARRKCGDVGADGHGTHLVLGIARRKDRAENTVAHTRAGDGDAAKAGTLREFKENAERMFLVGKLRENGWNISKTAEVIGTPRSNLYKKLEQYAIKQEMDG